VIAQIADQQITAPLRLQQDLIGSHTPANPMPILQFTKKPPNNLVVQRSTVDLCISETHLYYFLQLFVHLRVHQLQLKNGKTFQISGNFKKTKEI